jgi:hypothetical protein
MIEISIRSNIRDVQKSLSDRANRQLPYAIATAVNDLAADAQLATKTALREVFEDPTPFTVNSVRVIKGQKYNPVAIVLIMDRAATYLQPYELGGVNKLNSDALLKPVNQSVNQYGNLPRSTLQRLKSKRDVFVGEVKFHDGTTINGVWKRTRPVRAGRKAAAAAGGLKLLIRFTDAHKTMPIFHFHQRIERVVQANVNRRLGGAIARALATAR